MLAADEFTRTAYEALVDSKHHYDNLSWLVGGPVLALAGGLVAFTPSITNARYEVQVLERMVVAVLVCLMLSIWHGMYQRNRLWVEAANEAMRDFERQHGVRGAGVAFMELSVRGRVTLKNTDEKGQAIAPPLDEVLASKSMHLHVPVLVRLVGLLAIVACFLP